MRKGFSRSNDTSKQAGRLKNSREIRDRYYRNCTFRYGARFADQYAQVLAGYMGKTR